jgi:Domain of unknown function (DU1801)
MASSEAKTVATYLAELPADRRKAIAAARALVRKHLPKGYKEGMGYGMITWAIPLSAYPDTYNKQPLCYVALAAQKHYNTLYLMSPYADPKLYAWLAGEFKKAGKTFDMGKSCLHFKTMDDLVQAAVSKVVAGTTPAQLIKAYEAGRQQRRRPKAQSRKLQAPSPKP